MEYPRNSDDAQRHIQQVRREKGLDGPQSNTSDLENALVILSEQLYQKSTHFLSELIQNADDNSYQMAAPTLVITFNHSTRTLRIDCNEIGFSKANVEAICKIGRSTKSKTGNATRYIGEKGIGFKSVFKVADEVYLYSGYYSFKFDRHARLGMIAPTWAEFPDIIRPENTSVLLRLSDDYYPDELEHELRYLDPRLLLFLRKLQQIEVMSFNRLGSVTSSVVKRRNVPPTQDGAKMVNLHQDAALTRFKLIERHVKKMPPDPKRDGCTTSEVLLAFPVGPEGEPWIAPQRVYAFLPIRDYGFKFLIQADFLLIASREDIDTSSMWNRHLLAAIPDAFLQAVHTFNKGELRYLWMRFLPDRLPISGFFEQLGSNLIRCLSRADVIESWSGALTMPRNLKYIDKSFRDIRGRPLIVSSQTTSSYISERYDSLDIPMLERLGVRPLLPIEFVADLRRFIFAEPEVFIGKETTWHSQLAAALLLALYEEPGLMDELCKLPIIPLKTGQWVASRDRQTYFASADEELNVPEGTLLGEIDPAAITHLSRRNLFQELGAKPYSMQLVCNAIVREQLQASFEPGTLQLSDYIERTRFLFDCGWKNYEGHDLWVVTDAGTMKRGSETYMQSLKPYSAQDVLAGRSTAFNFLHREYHIGPSTKFGDWTRWLQDNLLLSEYPRLVVSLSPKLILAQDLRVLRKEDPLKLLLVLRDRWEYYCEFFVSPDECIYKEAKASLRSKVAAMEVPCFGGHVRPLGQTTLPTANIISGAMEAADFANLPEPEDPRWHFLSHFGVVIDPGIDQFIQCLRQMKRTIASVKRASNLYQQLQALANEHSKEIRNIFDNEELILVPSSSALKADSWVKSSTCAWSGPKWLRKTPLLDDIYGGQSSFFCETLGIRKTTWRTIISEAECIHASDDLDYITRVFRALNTFVEEADTHSQREMISALSEAYIFPIDAGQSGAAFDYLSSVRDRNMWFIADRIHLKESFDGLVPLLALKVDAIDNIAGLIHELGLRNRLLTEVAGSDVQTEGTKQVHGAFTAAFRSKTPYIARILPTSNTLRNEIVTKLCSATIYASETVSIRWTVKMDGVGEIEGRADAGRVKITHQGESIEIFLRHRDADNGVYPLDLREGLAKLCVLQDASQIRLLDFILNESNSKEIDEELSRRGYPQPSNDIQKILDIAQPGNLLDAEYNARNDISVPPLPDQQQFVGHTPNTKRFRSRRVDDEAPDNIQAFLAKFNLANSFREQLSQPWAEAGADNLLAHACRLDDVDPWNLLPRNRNQWDELLKAKGKPPGVATRTFWSANRHVQGKHFLSDRRNVRNAYAAVVLQDHRRNMVIKISNGIENLVTDELQFAAEHHVSRIFERRLGVAYIAGLHWTSPLRSRAGHLPYFTDDETTSTFTIEDNTGAFVTLLQTSGNTQFQSSIQSRVFHVEVIASEGDLGDKFCMDPEQVQKAWRCHTEGAEAQPDVFVLARVVNIRTKPRIALFVDPWRLHREGHLNLESASQYEATLSSKVAQTSCICLEENTAIIRSPSPVPMEKSTDNRHSRWFHKRKQSRLSLNQEIVIPQPVDTSFTYQRLQVGQTRLLELKHGSHDSLLFGEVHHVNVDKSPPYNALSYVWGSATKSYTLSTSQGPVHITASLYSALKRLRRQDETVHLWVDAICINQDDDHEKATQIRMLPNIFQSAEIVLCWIGEEHDDSSMAIETLLQIRTLDLAPQKWPAELPPIPASWKDGIPPVNDMIWWSIQNLFEREWFSRIWVIQEVVLARELKLLCGKYEMDWDDVLKAVEICLDDPGEPLPVDCYLRQTRPSFNPVHTLGLTRRAFENKAISARFSLLSLLDVFSHARSTKACDKLFALLGMASDANAAAFDPDYSSSLVVILRRFAHEFVRRGNAAALLYRAGSMKSVSFASWIPNWVANHPCRTISTWRGTGGVFAASGRSHLQANVNPVDANILQIAGTFIDSIVRVSSLSQRGKDIIMLINDAHAMIDQLPGYPTGETLANVKMKALIGSAVAPCIDNTVTVDDVIGTTAESNGLLNNAFEWKDDIVKVHRVEDVLTLLEKPKRSRDESYKYWLTAAAFFERLCNGRFFITSRGYVGVAPDRARVGDQICIIQGASVPFVLRQVKHHELGNVHSLLGETYVHGIMYGESLAFENVRREAIYIK